MTCTHRLLSFENIQNLYDNPSEYWASVSEICAKKFQEVKNEKNINSFIMKLQEALSLLNSFESYVTCAYYLKTDEALKTLIKKLKDYNQKIYHSRSLALRLSLTNTAQLHKNKAELHAHFKSMFSDAFKSNEYKKTYLKLSTELDHLEASFYNNIEKSKKDTLIHLANVKNFNELSSSLLEEGKANAKLRKKRGLVVELNTDNYGELISCCLDQKTRELIHKKYVGIATKSAVNNEPVLKKIIENRTNLAKLLGYSSYSDYAVSWTGLGSIEEIKSFLALNKQAIVEDYTEYTKYFKKYAKLNLGISKINEWDKVYIEGKLNQIVASEYKLTNIKWITNNILKQLSRFCSEFFNIGLTFDWENISCIGTVLKGTASKDKKQLGTVYIDLFKRDQKPDTDPFAITLSSFFDKKGIASEHNSLIVMNLTKNKQNVINWSYQSIIHLFHEMGHVLHGWLTKNESLGHNCETIEHDATEFPSQWAEKIIQKPDYLSHCGYLNNKKLSTKKVNELNAYYNLHSPAYEWAQIIDSDIDLMLNCCGAISDPNLHVAQVYAEYGFQLPKYNKLANNQLNHFFMGSLYYNYIWSERMVDHWNTKTAELSYAEQGAELVSLLNKAKRQKISELVQKK